MHCSHGAPILQSHDLINWEYISHSVPLLSFGPKYDLVNGTNAYMKVSKIKNCYYDAGLLIDDDDTIFQQTDSEVSTQAVFTSPSEIGYIEGSRIYKRNNSYYIFNTRPANAQFVLQSTTSLFGPHTIEELLSDIEGPIQGGGVPYQGSLVETLDGSGVIWRFKTLILVGECLSWRRLLGEVMGFLFYYYG
ncbi:hypothetical protein BDZ45DRAFT_732163 [Acephala macrosclerotiorum]|nr:hypothetical protein BDZ45DRAFT_732163 [Acephala macrosclerotiorum]